MFCVYIITPFEFSYNLNVYLAWKFVKLMEVAVSPDPDDAHAVGSVALVRGG